jgi:hypothetical protein
MDSHALQMKIRETRMHIPGMRMDDEQMQMDVEEMQMDIRETRMAVRPPAGRSGRPPPVSAQLFRSVFMQFSQSGILLTLHDIDRFIDDNAAALGLIPTSQARARLIAALQSLDDHAQVQATRAVAAAAATQRRLDLRQGLVADFVQPMVLIAKAEAKSTPELSRVRMPNVPAGDTNLAKAANAIADLAGKHAELFVAGGMSTDFVAEVHAAGDVLIQASEDRNSSVAYQIEATKGLKVQARVALQRIRVLHTFVRKQLKNEPAMYKKWLAIKAVPKRSTTTIAVTPPAAGTPATTPATTHAPTPTAAMPDATGGTA